MLLGVQVQKEVNMQRDIDIEYAKLICETNMLF